MVALLIAGVGAGGAGQLGAPESLLAAAMLAGGR
jgi:hypothetical protein